MTLQGRIFTPLLRECTKTRPSTASAKRRPSGRSTATMYSLRFILPAAAVGPSSSSSSWPPSEAATTASPLLLPPLRLLEEEAARTLDAGGGGGAAGPTLTRPRGVRRAMLEGGMRLSAMIWGLDRAAVLIGGGMPERSGAGSEGHGDGKCVERNCERKQREEYHVQTWETCSHAPRPSRPLDLSHALGLDLRFNGLIGIK